MAGHQQLIIELVGVEYVIMEHAAGAGADTFLMSYGHAMKRIILPGKD